MNRLLLAGLLLLGLANSALGQAIPIKLQKGYLVTAKCSAAGLQDLTAIVDTGVSETAIDLQIVRRLGLPMRSDSADFVTGEGQVQAVSIPNVQLGPLKAESLAGLAVDLSVMERDFGIHPDLLIGMDLLHRANFTIDYKSHELTFGPLPSLAHSAELLPESRFALVAAVVENKPVRLQVDTGIAGMLLYADRVPVRKDFADIGAHVVSLKENLPVDTAKISLEVGDWAARNIAVCLLERNSRPMVFDGLLGGHALARRRLAFDFEKMIVSWE